MGLDTFAYYFATKEELATLLSDVLSSRDVVQVVLAMFDDFECGRPLTKQEEALFSQMTGSLCGGLFSGDGCGGCFRGKVYDEDIESVTGQTLYCEFLSPTTVAEMSRKLQQHLDTLDPRDEDFRKMKLLAEFFCICRENSLGLYNWW